MKLTHNVCQCADLMGCTTGEKGTYKHPVNLRETKTQKVGWLAWSAHPPTQPKTCPQPQGCIEVKTSTTCQAELRDNSGVRHLLTTELSKEDFVDRQRLDSRAPVQATSSNHTVSVLAVILLQFPCAGFESVRQKTGGGGYKMVRLMPKTELAAHVISHGCGFHT